MRVVSEDGEPLELSPDTIIVQQPDGQLLLTNEASQAQATAATAAGVNGGVSSSSSSGGQGQTPTTPGAGGVAGGQYVIQYYNPAEVVSCVCVCFWVKCVICFVFKSFP